MAGVGGGLRGEIAQLQKAWTSEARGGAAPRFLRPLDSRRDHHRPSQRRRPRQKQAAAAVRGGNVCTFQRCARVFSPYLILPPSWGWRYPALPPTDGSRRRSPHLPSTSATVALSAEKRRTDSADIPPRRAQRTTAIPEDGRPATRPESSACRSSLRQMWEAACLRRLAPPARWSQAPCLCCSASTTTWDLGPAPATQHVGTRAQVPQSRAGRGCPNHPASGAHA